MKRLLLRLARSRVGRFCLGAVFQYMSWMIPAERLIETEHLLAFYHPVPSHKTHILIVPKRSIMTLTELPADDPFLREWLAAVQMLIERFQLEAGGYRLITNGGRYQDVPHLHFHLIAD